MKETKRVKRKGKNAVRDIKFSTRLNERERNILNRKAKKEKVTPSEFVRSLILA